MLYLYEPQKIKKTGYPIFLGFKWRKVMPSFQDSLFEEYPIRRLMPPAIRLFGGKSWLLVTKVVVEMLSGQKECENLFFASFRRDVDAML
jgi:hypothetical protein